MAAALSQTCKTVYAWIIPILYSTVVLTTPTQAASFQRAVLTSFNSDSEGHTTATRLTERPLHTYVHHLWVGRNRRSRANRTGTRPQLGGTGRERVGQTIIGRSRLWNATLGIVELCPSLRTLAMIGYPATIIGVIVPHLPVTLESLSIRVRNHATLDLPDISHLTALRDIVFVHTELTDKTVCLLLRSPSVQSITHLYNCSRPMPPDLGFPPDSKWDNDNLGMGVCQLRLVGKHASRGFKRMRIVSLFGRDTSAETELSGLQDYMASDVYDARIVVSAKEGCDGSGGMDHIKRWYDDWVAGLGHASRSCVPLTQEHPSWDL
ncbi:uncharacterized protein B0H18DRAFT_600324 [Fomitopsis serialis]|uniref:uncharacterized protein n=1 Tax=Fomitopsis serialis TaxID=139415 RepID=UPI0020082F24|nr:uncharacterized protein B0H18DRAFT_600324 [Neoantrodia serialis]KAH9933735.1 hypothetical protein B0H18DRAFT_600324 [Neoantrodia serialis]